MGDEDKDAGVSVQEVKVKPVKITENRKIMPVVRNLLSIHQSNPDDQQRKAAELKLRENTLKRLGVEESWYAKDELIGEGGVTPWVSILKEAKTYTSRTPAANDFERNADLSKPINEPNNFRLLQGMSDWEQMHNRQSREKTREKRERDRRNTEALEKSRAKGRERMAREKVKREEEGKRRQLVEDAKKELVKQKIEEAREQGKNEGKRLAGRVYDPNQRKEIDVTLDAVVRANRRGLIPYPEDVVQSQVLLAIDRVDYLSLSPFSASDQGRKYLVSFQKKYFREYKRKPLEEEIARECVRIDMLQKDLTTLRKYEARGVANLPQDLKRGFQEDPLTTRDPSLTKKRSDSYIVGFTDGYDTVRSAAPFTDENRPWYIPKSERSKWEYK